MLRNAMIGALSRTERFVPVFWLVTAASVPLSVRVFLPAIGTEVIFPAEPMLALIAVRNILWGLASFGAIGALRATMHTLMGKFALAWFALHVISACFSSDPLASWKAALVQAIYLTALAPATVHGMSALRDAWHARRRAHDAAFLLVVAIALTGASITGLDRMDMNFAAYPFYMDHTLYAAVLCFVLFRALGLLEEALRERPLGMRSVALIATLLALLAALVLSYSRAAWVGAALALTVHGAARLGAVRTAILGVLIALVTWVHHAGTSPGAFMQDQRDYASQDAGMGPMRTLLSISNTESDSNNKDRFIRWKAAWRMFKDDPLTGIGAGTWQARYLHYLDSADARMVLGPAPATLVADEPAMRMGHLLHLRDHAGRARSNPGSAHSEYLLALSELGFGGLLWWAAIIIAVASRMVAFLRARGRGAYPAEAWACGLAMIAYLVHATFNNFLDDCKAAALFWPCLALLFAPRAQVIESASSSTRLPLGASSLEDDPL
jgi:O-antigen ligase